MKKIFAGAIVSVFFMAVFAGCGGSSSSTDGGDPTSSIFTSGGTSLTATTVTTGSTKTTTVVGPDGLTILTATITAAGVSFAFPDVAGTTDIALSSALSSVPTNYASAVLATYVAGQTQGVAAICLTKDSPGCDWFPDTQCTLSCCADHDACYQLNGCGASSWIPFVGSDACKNCNYIAAGCIELACAGLIPTEGDRCYDNRCGQFYDCGEADCYTCTSPCDTISPAACTSTVFTSCCGNGSCELGETRENCPGDCAEGSGYNTCCFETSDCPSEELYTCPGSCCCCGSGEVCTIDGSHVCTGSAAMVVKSMTDDEITAIIKRCEGKPKSECR